MNLLEISKKKRLTSININNVLMNEFKQLGIPLSIVVEASLIYFLKLNVDKKILFLDNNSIKKTDIKEIRNQKKLKKEINKSIVALGICSSIPLLSSIGILAKIISATASAISDDINEDINSILELINLKEE